MSKHNPTSDDLKRSLTLIVGQQNILFDEPNNQHQRQSYLCESRGRKIGKAFAIVFPSTTDEVSRVVSACRFHKTPMVTQGGNTGRCFGAQTDDPNAVIINLKNMNRIRELDKNNMTVTVEAGCILQDLQTHVAQAGLFFPLSLGAEGSCQIGGNLATNAGGINVLRYGNARELTLGIEAVASNGNVLNELVGLRKNNTGYDLKHLLIGSEGTLAVITAATLKLFVPETHDAQAFIALDSVADAVACLQHLQHHFVGKISTFELIPQIALTAMHAHSDITAPLDTCHAWYVWYKIADANPDVDLFEENLTLLDKLLTAGLINDAVVANNQKHKQHFAAVREHIVSVQKHENVVIKFDIAVPISALPTLIDKGNAAVNAHFPDCRPYPFGHVGDGNLHYNWSVPANVGQKTLEDEIKPLINQIILDIVDGLNGTFSAEHGIGNLKLNAMQTYKDPVALDMMRRIKHAFDPFNLMNPGKVVINNKTKE